MTPSQSARYKAAEIVFKSEMEKAKVEFLSRKREARGKFGQVVKSIQLELKNPDYKPTK